MRTYIFPLSRNHLFLFYFSEFQISTDPVSFYWGSKELLSQWEWSILLVTSHSIISGIWSLDWDECKEQPPGSCKYSREKWFFWWIRIIVVNMKANPLITLWTSSNVSMYYTRQGLILWIDINYLIYWLQDIHMLPAPEAPGKLWCW